MGKAKVSKPAVMRDLKEFVDLGAIIGESTGSATLYALNFADVRSVGAGACNRHEPIDEPIGTINGTIKVSADFRTGNASCQFCTPQIER